MRGILTVVVCAGLLAGCGGDDDSGSASSDAGTGSASDTTSGTATTASTSAATTSSDATSAGTATDPSTTSDGSASTTDPSSTAGSSGDDSTSADDTGSLSCPIETDDIDCIQCVKPPCCEHWANCQNDDSCACIVECHVVDGGSLGACRSTCGDSTLYNALYFCGQMYCLGTCDWDNP
jgi:hypothetical protein